MVVNTAAKARYAAGKYGAVLRPGKGAELILKDHLVHIPVPAVDIAVDAAPVHWSSVGGDAIVGGHVDGLIDGTKGIVFPGTARGRPRSPLRNF